MEKAKKNKAKYNDKIRDSNFVKKIQKKELTSTPIGRILSIVDGLKRLEDERDESTLKKRYEIDVISKMSFRIFWAFQRKRKKDLNQIVDFVESIDSRSTIENITVQKLTLLEKLIKDDKSLKHKKKVEKKIWRVTV